MGEGRSRKAFIESFADCAITTDGVYEELVCVDFMVTITAFQVLGGDFFGVSSTVEITLGRRAFRDGHVDTIHAVGQGRFFIGNWQMDSIGCALSFY